MCSYISVVQYLPGGFKSEPPSPRGAVDLPLQLKLRVAGSESAGSGVYAPFGSFNVHKLMLVLLLTNHCAAIFPRDLRREAVPVDTKRPDLGRRARETSLEQH